MWRGLRAGMGWSSGWQVPGLCQLCHAWPARTFCPDCTAVHARPEPRCLRCAARVPPGVHHCGPCVLQPPPLYACVAAVAWGWPWADCVLRFKFHGEAGMGRPMAALMRQAPGVPDLVQQADSLLPLPLAPARLRQRGYNQALVLARALDSRKADARLLLRTRDTPPQRELDRAARQANVRNAFAVDPLLQPRVRGRHLLLVDDVMTSGASLMEAARVLRAAGAAQVSALVFARADEN